MSARFLPALAGVLLASSALPAQQPARQPEGIPLSQVRIVLFSASGPRMVWPVSPGALGGFRCVPRKDGCAQLLQLLGRAGRLSAAPPRLRVGTDPRPQRPGSILLTHPAHPSVRWRISLVRPRPNTPPPGATPVLLEPSRPASGAGDAGIGSVSNGDERGLGVDGGDTCDPEATVETAGDLRKIPGYRATPPATYTAIREFHDGTAYFLCAF